VTLNGESFADHHPFSILPDGLHARFRPRAANTPISTFLTGLPTEQRMDKKQRILICILILLLDLVVFFLPLSAIFLVYVIWQNPRWFREFLQQLDQPNPSA
jgi:hypothetical protein